MANTTDTTVKIEKFLLNRIDKLIKEKSKRIKYSGYKQFVNYAVLELLEKEEGEKDDKNKI